MKLRLTSILQTALIVLLASSVNTHAGMIDTDKIVNQQTAKSDLVVIKTALARAEVKQMLRKHGVQPQQIQNRVDQLTEEELHQLATQFSELPTGSGAGILLLVSGPVMLLLEFMGMTDLTTAF